MKWGKVDKQVDIFSNLQPKTQVVLRDIVSANASSQAISAIGADLRKGIYVSG